MKAIVSSKSGSPDALHLEEREKPSPKKNEVLVKVHAASVNALDWRPFTMPRFVLRIIGAVLRRPKGDASFGVDLAGRVEAVGANVKLFRPGDEVFGLCKGAFAEYICAPEDKLALKPVNVSFETAAAVPVAALTALQGLRDRGEVQPGQKVLINGSGGGVGTFAVQIAKSFGAEVSAVCSTRNLDVARSIGADHIIDYSREDFTESAQRYDVIIAVNGYHPVLRYRRALKPSGICVVLGGSMRQILGAMFWGPVLSRIGNKKMSIMMTHANQTDLVFLKELLESGKVVPVIDRGYPLAEVPEAIKYLIAGHARGKVVITVEQNDPKT
jgi:NADPH:quinone reductase-like Zn-dependent oxidoreductase